MAEKPAKPPPICLALVLCDAIYRDRASGKHTILGTFSAINAKGFPAIHEQTAVYAALTDGYGSVNIELRLIDPEDDDRVLLSSKGEVDFESPRNVLDLEFRFARIEFPHAGEYRFQLWAENELLMERWMSVHSEPARMRRDD